MTPREHHRFFAKQLIPTHTFHIMMIMMIMMNYGVFVTVIVRRVNEGL